MDTDITFVYVCTYILTHRHICVGYQPVHSPTTSFAVTLHVSAAAPSLLTSPPCRRWGRLACWSRRSFL